MNMKHLAAVAGALLTLTAPSLGDGSVDRSLRDGVPPLRLAAETTQRSLVTAESSWTATASMSVARANVTATPLTNRHVLVVGGAGVATTELYDAPTAQESMRRQLARELGPRGVRVITIVTGGIPETIGEGADPCHRPGRRGRDADRQGGHLRGRGQRCRVRSIRPGPHDDGCHVEYQRRFRDRLIGSWSNP